MNFGIKDNETAKYIANILSNLAVVGFGLALYQQKWWCLIIAIISAYLGAWINRRANK